MTGDEDVPRGQPPADPLRDMRRWAIVAFLGIDVFLVVADVTGRLFRDSEFRVEALVFGLSFGTTLTLLGLEGFTRVFGGDDR